MLRKAQAPLAGVAVCVLLAIPVGARSADEGGQNIPITDPALLERLGFEPEATNVFATPQALQQLLMDPAERSLAEQAGQEGYRAVQATQPPAEVYGTFEPGFSPVWGKKFLPNGTATEHEWASDRGRYCLSGSTNFHAQFEDIPHGARLFTLELRYFDASPEALEATLFQQCQGAVGEPTTTALSSFTSSTSAGHAAQFVFLSDLDVTINSQDCVYYVRVRLDDTNGSCSEGEDLAITKVDLVWHRQISPAPATATFNDVPTSHQFFQHIEALAASGITGGCGGDSFCPNAPLTRGQMAVFLAKALGLHWSIF